MSRHHPEGKPAPYELRIHGLLGPVLLAALPFTAVASVPRETVRVTVADRDELLDVLQAIVNTGAEIEAICSVSGSAGEPQQT